MRVLMLTWEFPPFIVGGLGMACYGLAKSLLKQDVEIFLVLPSEKSIYFHLTHTEDVDILSPVFLDVEQKGFYEKKEFKTLEERLKYLGISLRPEVYASPEEINQFSSFLQLSYEGMGVSQREILESIKVSLIGEGEVFRKVKEYAVRVGQIASSINFDIIHAHDWLTYPAAIMVKSMTGKPLISHIHATEFDRAGGTGNKQIHDIEYSGLALSNRVLAVSNYTASLVVQRYRIDPGKIRVVYNAYQIEKEKNRHRRIFKTPVILFLGRITLQKGPDYFLEVAKRVVELFPDVHFIMAGAGDMERQLIHKSAYYKLGTNFLFTGFLKRRDVERILSSSDIFILPSVSEPFGIAPLEAMSYGIVAIISRQSGVAEVVQNAIKIDFWDVDKMVSIIVDLLNNPEKIKETGIACAREVEKIGWDEAGSVTKRVYEELLC